MDNLSLLSIMIKQDLGAVSWTSFRTFASPMPAHLCLSFEARYSFLIRSSLMKALWHLLNRLVVTMAGLNYRTIWH